MNPEENIKLMPVGGKDIWEEFIFSHSFYPLFFQGWEWGELERSRGKEVFNLGFFAPKKSFLKSDSYELIGVALAVLVRARRGTFLHIRGGPLLKWDDKEISKDVSELLIDFAKNKGCDFLRVSPNILKSEKEKSKWLLSLGFKYCQMHDVDAEITWVLDLKKSEEEILKGMRDSTRYLIKKGLKNPDLKIVKSTNSEDLKYFWEIYQDTVKRQKWHAFSFEYIKEEFEEYVKANQALLFLAEYKGKYIGASIFIYYQGQVFYHHSGSLTEFRNIPAMYLLHWESILEGKKRGLRLYNFFGIARGNNPKHPWAGLSLFKKGFGGSQNEMIHALDYPITKKYWITHYYEKFEKKIRGY